MMSYMGGIESTAVRLNMTAVFLPFAATMSHHMTSHDTHSCGGSVGIGQAPSYFIRASRHNSTKVEHSP